MRVGLDPWPGSYPNHRLFRELMEALAGQHIFTLAQAGDERRSSIRGQGWKDRVQLGLDGPLGVEWEQYVNALHRAHIPLTEHEDRLVWKNSPDGKYSSKIALPS